MLRTQDFKAEIFHVFLCHNSENKAGILGKQQSMNQPSVFISCVSPEFRQTRSRVAAILTRLGYTPVIQEIFGTEPGDLRQVLRDKIDACEGLIQIVGHGYGAEPPTVDADYGRVSYTQFEFLIDELAASFAEMEGTDRSSQVFDEMTRILAARRAISRVGRPDRLFVVQIDPDGALHPAPYLTL